MPGRASLPRVPLRTGRPTTDSNAGTEEGLLRGIGRASLVAMVINCVVGADIFGLPGRMHAPLGPALLAYLAAAGWCDVAIAMAIGFVPLLAVRGVRANRGGVIEGE